MEGFDELGFEKVSEYLRSMYESDTYTHTLFEDTKFNVF